MFKERDVLVGRCVRAARTHVVVVLLIAVSLAFASGVQAATVPLPAGSVDGLAAAIEAAGPGGTVIVETGLHTELHTVAITHPVSIIGEPGATIESVTAVHWVWPQSPVSDPDTSTALMVDPAFHIDDTKGVRIEGLTLQPAPRPATQLLAERHGSCAVLVENADGAEIVGNTISRYQFGVLVEKSNDVTIGGLEEGEGNTISSFLWETLADYCLTHTQGVVVFNGKNTQILGNTVSDAMFGLWTGSGPGTIEGNNLVGSWVGLVLCYPPPVFEIAGKLVGSQQASSGWSVSDNYFAWNMWTGIWVVHDANNNVIESNQYGGGRPVIPPTSPAWPPQEWNGWMGWGTLAYGYDIELAGGGYLMWDDYFMGECRENLVDEAADVLIRDCGKDNVVDGGLLDQDYNPPDGQGCGY
jgi:hypothetical protein